MIEFVSLLCIVSGTFFIAVHGIWLWTIIVTCWKSKNKSFSSEGGRPKMQALHINTAHGMLEHTRIISQIRSMASLESIHRNFTDMQHSISLGVSDYVLYWNVKRRFVLTAWPHAFDGESQCLSSVCANVCGLRFIQNIWQFESTLSTYFVCSK